MLAYIYVPREHRAKTHSSNPIERLNGEIKRRTDVVGVFPNEAAVFRLVGAILLEQSDEWAMQRARDMTLETITALDDTAPSGCPPWPTDRRSGVGGYTSCRGAAAGALGAASLVEKAQCQRPSHCSPVFADSHTNVAPYPAPRNKCSTRPPRGIGYKILNFRKKSEKRWEPGNNILWPALLPVSCLLPPWFTLCGCCGTPDAPAKHR